MLRIKLAITSAISTVKLTYTCNPYCHAQKAIYTDRVELWAREQDIAKLKASGIAAAATVDVAAESFKAEKARKYMDKVNIHRDLRVLRYSGGINSHCVYNADDGTGVYWCCKT